MENQTPASDPLLRTLAPLLRNLDKDLRGWLDGPHRYPLPLIARAYLEGLSGDLRRQSEALNVDRPVLVIILMGGTGVGKSTLLNALAGAPIAQAAHTRPTTRDPVVYYHESIHTNRLDPVLRHCKLAQHDRESLAQKIIVDTPDLDSNDLANREKLLALLPVADVVLYVGSQEKYHDKIGWELFKEQRKRRAFAFVLNKWDRCLHAGAAGLRPDEDLLRDLNAEGFENPLLFRTVAQSWVDSRLNGSPNPPDELPPGEQFADLLNWLEMGLTRLEIEAVKAHGVGQLLRQVAKGLDDVRPPDLTDQAAHTRAAWERILRTEADVYGDVLLSTLDPYQTEIEHHFSVEGQQKFRGLMSLYMGLTNKVRYAGAAWRNRIPFLPPAASEPAKETSWNLTSFAHECTRVAGEKVLDKRGGAIVNRLLVEADRCSFPLQLLNNPTAEAGRGDWRQRFDRALIESLAEVERICTQPHGFRKFTQVTIVTLANVLPEIALLGSIIWELWQILVVSGNILSLGSPLTYLIPVFVTLAVLIVMQVLVVMLLPLRWAAVRNEFHTQLNVRLNQELLNVYASIPEDTARLLLEEREQVDRLAAALDEVLKWLEERQSQASISGLYGS